MFKTAHKPPPNLTVKMVNSAQSTTYIRIRIRRITHIRIRRALAHVFNNVFFVVAMKAWYQHCSSGSSTLHCGGSLVPLVTALFPWWQHCFLWWEHSSSWWQQCSCGSRTVPRDGCSVLVVAAPFLVVAELFPMVAVHWVQYPPTEISNTVPLHGVSTVPSCGGSTAPSLLLWTASKCTVLP